MLELIAIAVAIHVFLAAFVTWAIVAWRGRNDGESDTTDSEP